MEGNSRGTSRFTYPSFSTNHNQILWLLVEMNEGINHFVLRGIDFKNTKLYNSFKNLGQGISGLDKGHKIF
jgi:hypothetical protein